MTACVILPQPFFLKMGHGGAARCLLHALCGAGWRSPWSPQDPFFLLAVPCWLCCAVLCWLHHGRVAAQAAAPAHRVCQVQAGTKAKANRSPGGPSSGCHSVPPHPWESSWPQDSPWLLALLSLRRLAVAEHSSSVLPHGPWPQIRRGTGLGVTPMAAGCQARRQQLRRIWPGGHCLVLCQQTLRAASWLHGQGWCLPVSSTIMPGCRTHKALAGPGVKRAPSHPCGGLDPDHLPGDRWAPSGTEAMGLVAASAPGEVTAQ